MSVTDDALTVSVTDDDMNKSSYRGTATNPIKITEKKSPSASGRDVFLSRPRFTATGEDPTASASAGPGAL